MSAGRRVVPGVAPAATSASTPAPTATSATATTPIPTGRVTHLLLVHSHEPLVERTWVHGAACAQLVEDVCLARQHALALELVVGYVGAAVQRVPVAFDARISIQTVADRPARLRK